MLNLTFKMVDLYTGYTGVRIESWQSIAQRRNFYDQLHGHLVSIKSSTQARVISCALPPRTNSHSAIHVLARRRNCNDERR
jgi:hypothetical protein